MTIEEIFNRVVRGHLFIIFAAALVPIAMVLLSSTGGQTDWRASVRIQAGASSPVSTTEADGISSRVLALATTPSLLTSAISDAHVNRDPDILANKHVSVHRLGLSSVVELSVTDPDKAIATKLVTALAARVTQFMNEGDQERFTSILAKVDQQLKQGSDHRQTLTDSLNRTTNELERQNIKSDLQGLDETMGRLSDQRTALVLSDANRSQAVVVDAKSPDLLQVPSSLLPRAALGMLLGLVLGVALAAGVETFRPRIPNSRTLARMLDTPLLGTAEQRPGELARVVSLAARRQGVSTVVLVPADPRHAGLVGAAVDGLGGEAASHDRESPSRGTGSSSRISAAKRHTDADTDTDTDGSRQLQIEQDEAESVMHFGDITYTSLADLRPWSELVAGVVVVSSGRILRARYEDLSDLIQAGRWPVIGLLDASSSRWSWMWWRQRDDS